MKFYLADDLHLEFSGYSMPGDPEGILLLAGDICLPGVYEENRTDAKALKLRPRFNQFWKEVSERYKHVYYTPGNHEYYHFEWETTVPFCREMVAPYSNVTVLDKESVDLGDDVMLWGATFWTDMGRRNPIVESEARHGMNDYRVIRRLCPPTGMYGGTYVPLHPQDTIAEHETARASLTNFLRENKDKKCVIMTHMAPSLRSSHPKFGGTSNPLNWAYCSELDYFVLDNPQIKVWVHGHTHDSHDYLIGEKTRVICNPRGYSYKDNAVEQNPKFNDKLCFEV